MNSQQKSLARGLAAGGAAVGLVAGITGIGVAIAARWMWRHWRSSQSNHLHGQTVLISGGSRGLASLWPSTLRAGVAISCS